MSHIDPDVTIADSMEQPKKGKSGEGEYEQHTIPGQIAGSKHLSNAGVAKTGKTKRLGLVTRIFNMPGSI